jgi:hypothetical protein
MVQLSNKRIDILVASIIIVALACSVIYLLIKEDNVTLSGTGSVSPAIIIAPTIQTIEFQDIQTGTNTTFHFTFNTQSANSGNYSVTLKNGHTYNVYIGYSILGFNYTEPQFKDFITTLTVDAAAGQTAITKNFTYNG